jgi:uncharacterized protein (DUF2062 family)
MSIWSRKVVEPVKSLLLQGMTPEKLSLTFGLTFCLGLCPVLGSTTLLCFVVAAALRLNQPLMQSLNYFLYPLQLLLFIPFLQAGAWLFDAAPVNLTMEEVWRLIRTDVMGMIRSLWTATMGALTLWLLVSIPVLLSTRAILTPLFRNIAGRLAERGPLQNAA